MLVTPLSQSSVCKIHTWQALKVGVSSPLEILQSDWSRWNSTGRTKLYISLGPVLLPYNGEGGNAHLAIGLPQGHWYKCPNGHTYAIGDCGGAMQRAKCPECRAEIGGMSHALATGNVHAPEMDGSRHAAWSEGANLANFDPLEFDRL